MKSKQAILHFSKMTNVQPEVVKSFLFLCLWSYSVILWLLLLCKLRGLLMSKWNTLYPFLIKKVNKSVSWEFVLTKKENNFTIPLLLCVVNMHWVIYCTVYLLYWNIEKKMLAKLDLIRSWISQADKKHPYCI